MRLPPETICQLVGEAFGSTHSPQVTAHPTPSVVQDEPTPIQLDLSDRRGQIQRLHNRLEEIDGIRITAHPADRDPRSRALLRFMIPDPTEPGHYFRADELRLESNQASQLVLNAATSGHTPLRVMVSDYDQIVGLVHLVHKQYARERATIAKQRLINRMRDLAQAQQASTNQ